MFMKYEELLIIRDIGIWILHGTVRKVRYVYKTADGFFRWMVCGYKF